MKRFKRLLKQLFNIIKKPEMKILPGQLAFFLVLSIIPAIVLLGLICSTFKVPFTNVINVINEVLPEGIGSILVSFINREGLNLTLGISVIVGFILASNGPRSIIVTSNTLYGIEHSNYIKRYIKSILLTVMLLLLVIFTLVVLAFGNDILNFILSLKIFSLISDTVYKIFLLFKWPVGLFIVFFMTKLIYSIAPDSYIPSKYNNRGSIFTTVTWSIVTVIYSYYVTNFNNYNIFYGSLTNIILLMLWVYILAYILVLGMAINANDYKNAIKNNKNE